MRARRKRRQAEAERRTLEFVRLMHPGQPVQIVRDERGSTILVTERVQKKKEFEVG